MGNRNRAGIAVSLLSVMLTISLVLPFTTAAAPGVPRILNVQGRLMNSGGTLLGGSGTEYCFRFSFYDTVTTGSGTRLWPSGSPSTMTVMVRNGVYNAGIGDTNAGGDTLDFNFQDTDTAYLNVEVATKVGATCAPGDGTESFETLSPRQRILASGYAINASMVGGFLAAQHASGNQLPVLSSGNLILGGINPILSATTTNTLTLQGSSSGDLQFFSSANRITASGDAVFAGSVTATGASTTHATTTNLTIASAFTFGSATGVLKAIAGAVTTTLLDLASDVTGILGIANGGTGTSTAPTYGQLLVGNAIGGYDLLATSSLGIVSGGGTWGSITGTLSDQADLQSALDSKFSLSAWFATTTRVTNGGTGLTQTPQYGEVLLGNGSGGFSLVATSSLGITGGGGGGGGVLLNVQVFTADDSYTPTAGTTHIEVVVTGGGGGGGGADNFDATTAESAAGGGGAGATTIELIEVGNLNVPETITVGNGGSVGSAAGGNGGVGGSSSFGSHASANGGNGGIGAPQSASTAACADANSLGGGGAGGSAGATGDINLGGGAGTAPVYCLNNLVKGGVGGASYWGGGGAGGDREATGACVAGADALTYGAGGGGAVCVESTAGATGGAGAGGSVIVYEYGAFDGILGTSNGGTGTSTAPTYGQVLVGNATGGYDLVATSSLGISGGGGASFQYPFVNNATSTTLSFTNGIIAASSTFTGISSNVATVTNATTTSLFTSQFSIGSLTGVLRAAAGVVTSGLINLATEVTGILGITNGGTGTSTAPSYGQVLVGNALGGYDLVATSSLGILSGGGTWGSITGTLSDQTDLQAELDARLTLSDWYATTTDGLAEGVTNRYYSDSSVNSFLAGSSTIPKTYTANIFNSLQTFESASTTNISARYASSTEGFFGSLSIGNLTGILRATAGSIATALLDLANDVTGVLGIANGGTGTSTAPTYGQLLVGNAIGGYDLLATSSLRIDLVDTEGVLDESQGGTGVSDYILGDLLYASGAGTLSRLPIGGPGQVLKVTGGIPAWGADLTSGGGGGGGGGYFSTTTNELAIYPTNTSHTVIIGSNATATLNSIFEVSGRSYFSNVVGIGTTSPGSIFSIGNVANFDASGSTLYTSLTVPSLSIGGLTGIVRATAGVISAALLDLASDVTGILQVANGGTGWDSIAAGTLLTGNGTGALATTTVDASLQLLGGSLSLNTGNINTWTALQTFSFASTSNFSAGQIAVGETATTTIDTAGNISVGGTLNVNGLTQLGDLSATGNATFFAATTTNLMVTSSSTLHDFTSRFATSSLLYTNALRGAGLAGCDTVGDKLLWNAGTGQFSCGVDGGGSGISSLGAPGQLQTGAIQTFATSSDTNLGITIMSAGDQHTFAMNWLGTLAVGRGGTGWGNIESGTLLTGNGSGALATTSIGSSLQLAGATLGLNLANPNLWSGLQQFGTGASTTAFSASDFVMVGRTATTTIRGETNATSTFAGAVSFTSASTTATSTLAGVRLSNIQNCTQALETNASGDVVCGTDSGADGVIITTFTIGGTWTKADYPGISFTQVIVTAGGASGGTADSSDGATTEEAAGGGGAGGTSISMISAASLGVTESVVVGLGGASNAAAGNGNNGGNSSFGAHASSTGGGAGLGDSTLDSNTPEGWGGGAGGATTTALGDMRLAGGDGAPGTAVAADVSGGMGGASYWGGGGRGGHTTATPQAANGANGLAYGSGGGGGAIEDTTTAGVGGKGGDGVVVTMNYTSSGGDLAEWYETKDDVEAADVVAISADSYEYDSKLGLQKSAILEKATPRSGVVGVVSSVPYETIGMDILGKATHPRAIALAGRVPVKASLENGYIKAGDLLTISSTPGVAMRSTKAGVTIGRALEDMVCADSESATTTPLMGSTDMPCTVLIMVNTSYSTGALLNVAFRDLGMDTDTISTKLNYSRMILAEMMQQKKNITASTTLSEVLTDRLAAGLEVITPRVVTDAVVTSVVQPLERDVRIQLTDGKFVIERLSQASTTVSFDTASSSASTTPLLSIDALGNAVFAGAITGADFIVGTREKPGGITMHDAGTGEPYCARIMYGRLETFAGTCRELVDIFEATEFEGDSESVDESTTLTIENSATDNESDVDVTEESELDITQEAASDTSDTASTDEPAPSATKEVEDEYEPTPDLESQPKTELESDAGVESEVMSDSPSE